MISEKRVLGMIFDSLKNVKAAKLAVDEFAVNEDSALLGMGGGLDSIAFITFITDLEEKVEDEIGKEFVIKLQEIHDLNEDKKALIAKDLARLLTQLINRSYAK